MKIVKAPTGARAKHIDVGASPAPIFAWFAKVGKGPTRGLGTIALFAFGLSGRLGRRFGNGGRILSDDFNIRIGIVFNRGFTRRSRTSLGRGSRRLVFLSKRWSDHLC